MAALVQSYRQLGFTCPDCSGHKYTGYVWNAATMGSKYPNGVRIGLCAGDRYSAGGCGYEWNRDNSESEQSCIFFEQETEALPKDCFTSMQTGTAAYLCGCSFCNSKRQPKILKS